MDPIKKKKDEEVEQTETAPNQEPEQEEHVPEAAPVSAAHAAPATAQTDDTAEQIKSLKEENARLRMEREVMAQAASLGIEEKAVPYLCRMLDLSAAVDNDGNINQEAVTQEMNQLIEAVPGIKKQHEEQTGGFRPMGGNGSRDKSTDEEENKVRSWFGLSPKK